MHDLPENTDIQKGVERIVQHELELFEQRIRARIDAVTDDIRSEMRALRLVDNALDARVRVMEGRQDMMQTMNEQQIKLGVKLALHEVFSPIRILGALSAFFGFVLLTITLVAQFSNLFRMLVNA